MFTLLCFHFLLTFPQIVTVPPSDATHPIIPPAHIQHFERTQERKRRETNVNRYALGEKNTSTFRDPKAVLDRDIARGLPDEYSAVPVCISFLVILFI